MTAPNLFEEAAALAGRKVPLAPVVADGGARATPERVARADSHASRVSLGLPGRVGRSSSGTPKVPAVVREKGGSDGTSTKRKKSGCGSSRPSSPSGPPLKEPPPTVVDRPLDLSLPEEDLSFSDSDCAHFYGNPYDFAVHMVKFAKGMDARWKSLNCHDSDLVGIRAERDRFRGEVERLSREFYSSREAYRRLEALSLQAQADREVISKERDALKAKVGELEKQLSGSRCDLKSVQSQLSSAGAELKSSLLEKSAAEATAKRMAGGVVDAAHGGYNKALDQVRLVHPQVDLDEEVFKFAHKVVDGQLRKYRDNGEGFEVIFP